MLKTVSRALQLLNVVGAHPEGLNLSELARELMTNKQDAFRLVRTLAAFQFVNSDPAARKVRLGPGFLRLAELARPHLDLRQIAMPALVDLRDKTGETACLHIRSRNHRVCIVQVESRDELRCVANIGEALPLTTGAPGRIFLAYMPDQERARILKDIKRLTSETIMDRKRLNRTISLVRQIGYTIARNETVLGMAAISAPVFDATGRTVAAMTALGPSQRLSKERLAGFSDYVLEAAARISAALGHDSDLINTLPPVDDDTKSPASAAVKRALSF